MVALLALAFEGTYGTPSAMIESMRQRVISGERLNLVPFRTISTFFYYASIELGQLFINRSVDVDDLILNFAGGCAGAALCAGVKRKLPVLEEFAK